ncbi:MAG: DUF354 domain-containing protein [Candidatus Woykebacteria bacterium]
MPKIAFVCFHPVDSHVIRHVNIELLNKAYETKILFSEKEDIIEDILKKDGFNYKKIGSIKQSTLGKITSSIIFEMRLFLELMKFKPDLVFSPSSIYTGLISKILGIPLICWADTETATFNLKTSLPFIDSLLVPDSFYKNIGNNKKVVRFDSYKEIAYLHPKWFEPDRDILTKLNIKKNEKIVLMRFSALKAMHDIGLKSISEGMQKNILRHIKKIEKYAKVFISMSEKDLDKEFQKYKLNIHPSEYASLLSYCTLYIGEGTTTASEAGVLGVPWINIQKTTRGYLIDQEYNYNLGFRIEDIDRAFSKANELLQDKEIKTKWVEKREKLLNDKIDTTSFLLWFIDNYPKSHDILIENPDYQYMFK